VTKKQKILFIPFEFLTWERAGSWPYSVHLGIEEGFAANNVELFTVPSLYEIPSHYHASWLSHVDRLFGKQQFDQIWFFLRHTQIGDDFFQWAAEHAPVRVGLIMETVQPTEEELVHSPHLHEVIPLIKNSIQHLTHVLAFDEHDATVLRKETAASFVWCPWAIPSRYLQPTQIQPTHQEAAFFGYVYKQRQKFFDHPSLQQLLKRVPRTDFNTNLPQEFDTVSTYVYAQLQNKELLPLEDLQEYMEHIRRIRRLIFDEYISELSHWMVNVVLPAGFKGYSNRLAETAAAGIPLISWNVPSRPNNYRLFEPEKDILLFDPHDPEELAEQIHKVRNYPVLRQYLIENLHKKIYRYHTMEHRIWQMLEWIEHGSMPDYGLL
jgi:glycosyltransferase involved in cell wall biosynthesis